MENPKLENKEKKKSVEESANYEGNHTLLLVERLQNPEIKERLIDNLYEHTTTSDDEDYREGQDSDKKGIEKRINKSIEKALHSTNIEFPKHPEDPNIGEISYGEVFMYIGAINPDTGKPYNVKNYNVVEAHEKGHQIRYFIEEINSDFTKRLSLGFDFSKFKFSNSELDLFKNFYKKLQGKEIEEKEVIERVKKYISNPNELFERMSQLKNYFGFKGAEKFTIEYLKYAREHYKEDIGNFNDMHHFLSMITPETEEKFIELMNTLGI